MRATIVLALLFGPGLASPVPSCAATDELPRRGTLGVRLGPVPDDIRSQAGLDRVDGAMIEGVFPGSTAEAGGIRPGDVLLALDGQPIKGIPAFVSRIAALAVGQRFELALLRAGGRTALSLTLQERPRDRGEGFDVLHRHAVSGGARIRLIVTRPQRPGRHPVLFLIQGLGAVTVDQPLASPEPYSRILSSLARDHVTVRVEKPGIGDSEGGPYVDTDFETELDVYRQALLAVRTYDFVAPDEVVVFGHSIGGVFAPFLASEVEVKGVAVYGTLVKTLPEYILENTRRQAALAGDDPASIDATLRELAATTHLLLADRMEPAEIARVHPELRSVLDRFAPGGRLYGRTPRFWSQLASRNLPTYWAKGNAHVLAVWGRNDFIATEADHPLIAGMVNRARPGKGTYVALEGSDHAFRDTVSIEDSFRRWSTPGVPLNPRIIDTLRSWIDKLRHPN
jgi:hypothetical protein